MLFHMGTLRNYSNIVPIDPFKLGISKKQYIILRILNNTITTLITNVCHDKNNMNIKTTLIDNLKTYLHNPKLHPPEQIEKIVRSIKEFGFLVPILIDADNNIIAGHGRLMAAYKLDMVEIPTICIDHLTEEQIQAYRIADNKLTESGWNLEMLGIEMDALNDMNFNIDLTGFDDIELEEMFAVPVIEEPPKEFQEFDENMQTENECPKCGYRY